jgi:hypothetical protein
MDVTLGSIARSNGDMKDLINSIGVEKMINILPSYSSIEVIR